MTLIAENPTNAAVQGALIGSGLLRWAASDPVNTFPTSILQERYLVRRGRVEPATARLICVLAFGEVRHDR